MNDDQPGNSPRRRQQALQERLQAGRERLTLSPQSPTAPVAAQPRSLTMRYLLADAPASSRRWRLLVALVAGLRLVNAIRRALSLLRRLGVLRGRPGQLRLSGPSRAGRPAPDQPR